MGRKDDPRKPDRSLIEGGEDYEVRELATAAGISVEQASELVEKHGGDRRKIAAEARALQMEMQEEQTRH